MARQSLAGSCPCRERTRYSEAFPQPQQQSSGSERPPQWRRTTNGDTHRIHRTRKWAPRLSPPAALALNACTRPPAVSCRHALPPHTSGSRVPTVTHVRHNTIHIITHTRLTLCHVHTHTHQINGAVPGPKVRVFSCRRRPAVSSRGECLAVPCCGCRSSELVRRRVSRSPWACTRRAVASARPVSLSLGADLSQARHANQRQRVVNVLPAERRE